MAHKLGIPFTADLVALGTNAAISNALIEKAVAAGKTEAEIDAAMSTLWRNKNIVAQFACKDAKNDRYNR